MKQPWFLPLAAVAIGLGTISCDRAPTTPGDALRLGGPSFQALVDHIEDKVPLGAFAAFIPCANGGAGELAVAFNPDLHVVLHFVANEGGRIHSSGHFQPIGNWDGIGQVTGDVYQPTGVTRSNINLDGSDGAPLENTFVNNFRWIGPGPGNNLLVHATIHITVNANGDVTAEVVNTTVDCK